MLRLFVRVQLVELLAVRDSHHTEVNKPLLPSRATMRTHIALLKGINVGGKNLVKMVDLKSLFLELGFEDPETLLQSGNVAFRSDQGLEAQHEMALGEGFAKRFGFHVDFVIRNAAHWQTLIASNPFTEEALVDPSHLLIHFFRQPPEEAAIRALKAAIQGPERLHAIVRDVFVVYPDGIGTSTVTRTPGWNKLMGGSTARNWNTILKLNALL